MDADEAVELAVRRLLEHFRADPVLAVTPEYFDPRSAARYMGVSHYKLQQWRGRGEGPPYSKITRMVRYKRSMIDAWMAERRAETPPRPPANGGRHDHWRKSRSARAALPRLTRARLDPTCPEEQDTHRSRVDRARDEGREGEPRLDRRTP